ncbi:MAG TPA: helix-turn-helix domain-containing protein, partial [Aquabacterium sp.]|nr:helix-turn-helix domain-containing protein [Aquabacterium sp.]
MTVSKKHPRTPSSDTKAPRRSITPLHDTPTKLVEAALSLFARHGIEAVSIRQITLAAGQSNESAVHYHFRNKAGLIAAVLDY